LKLFELESESKKLIQPEIFPEIIAAATIAIVGGILSLYIENYKLFTRFVQKIGATKTYGDEDVWDFVFNSPSSAVDFVHLRDFEQRVTYAGFVEAFSESGQCVRWCWVKWQSTTSKAPKCTACRASTLPETARIST
jgi:hypothetical protein